MVLGVGGIFICSSIFSLLETINPLAFSLTCLKCQKGDPNKGGNVRTMIPILFEDANSMAVELMYSISHWLVKVIQGNGTHHLREAMSIVYLAAIDPRCFVRFIFCFLQKQLFVLANLENSLVFFFYSNLYFFHA